MDTHPILENQAPSSPTSVHESQWPSILQLVLSLFAALSLWMAALLFLFLGLFPRSGSGGQLASTRESAFIWAVGLAFSGLLLLPSAGYALMKLMDRPVHSLLRITPGRARWVVFLLVVVVFPLVLFLGYFVSQGSVSWLILPVLHILAIGIPVFVLQYLGRYGLPKGSPQRDWGVLAAGLILGPSLIMLLEIAAMVILGLCVMVYIASNPALSADLYFLAQRITTMSPNPQRIFQLLEPYLYRPGVIFLGFAFLSGIVPLIEETIKPIGVWLLAGRHLEPVDGFSLGLLSGAGYAFFESLLLSAGGVGWAATVLARAGTSIIHILTAGIMGWALVSAWNERRYLRLGLTYLGMVFIHGTWNGITLWSTLAGLRYPDQASAPTWARIGYILPVVLVVIVIILFSALIYLNHQWRRAIIHQPVSEANLSLPPSQIGAASTGNSEPVDNSGIQAGEYPRDEARD